MSKIIGIDLGTTFSCVSVFENGSPIIITNSEGFRTTPSVVAITKDGEILVGQIAKRQATINSNTFFSIKRFIGSSYLEVKQDVEKMPFKVKSGNKGEVLIEASGKDYTPPEISAKVLQKLKSAAEDYLGQPVTEAVITVPAYFNDSQRQATKDAGKIAGLDIKRIVNEPTAAALAYGLDKKKDEKIAVYDFGGGTFDISILEVGENLVEVLSTNGDTHLGGDNIDERLIEFLLSEFKKDTGMDISKDKMAMQRLRESAEKAKIELSSTLETEINLPFLTADSTGPKHLSFKLSRTKFEQMIDDIIQKTIEPCKKAVQDAGLKVEDLNEILLVGGSTRIPMVIDLVKKFFKKEPNKSVNPDEVVAIGAGIQAAILGGDVKDLLLLDVTPLSLGIETLGGVMTKLIDRNSTIPTKKSQIFSTAGDNQTMVEIHVLQGERDMAPDNRTLGRFQLTNLPPAPRGIPKIEVTFDIDANGIVHVSAKDQATNREQSITITSSSGLNKDEINALIKEAEKNAEEDKKKREKVEIKNQAESMIFMTEKNLKEYKDKLSSDVVENIEKSIEKLREVLKTEDIEKIKEETNNLQTAAHKMAEVMYANAKPNEEPKPSEETKTEEPKKEDTVYDV